MKVTERLTPCTTRRHWIATAIVTKQRQWNIMGKAANIKLCQAEHQNVICENCWKKETLGTTSNYKPVNGVLCDAVCQLYQAFFTSKMPHSFTVHTHTHTHMNINMLIQKVWSSINKFSWNSQLLNQLTWRPSTPNLTKIRPEIWTAWVKNSFMLYSKVRQSLSQLSQNSCLLDNLS